MPYIELGNDAPGMTGLLRYRPETGKVLSELAEVLLRGDNTLSRGERELIASYVSTLNGCRFCAMSHGAFAAAQLPGGESVVADACSAPDTAPVSGKLRALLRVAAAVRDGGSAVTPQDVAAARQAGATDAEIHDTVLIAAAFCMFNRYVDGLGTTAPDDPALYAHRAAHIVAHGYLRD
ncbi:carboxymuconolactone decarboxylase family protein [Nonomuraea purpurea]|uniref:Carboxymuconolactone decarboxylase family protein n=1 Tax=Nonomuraea purpurea TaxID=1849276 RepID=A0ABV8GE29_9ACTN